MQAQMLFLETSFTQGWWEDWGHSSRAFQYVLHLMSLQRYVIYAVKVKRHNVCKRHVAIDTGFKASLNVQFFSVLFQWEKFRRALWKLLSEKGAKIKEKDAWLHLQIECQHLSQCETPARVFVSSTADVSTEKVVAFVKVRVFVSSRIRQYDMPSISQWLRIRCQTCTYDTDTRWNNCFT